MHAPRAFANQTRVAYRSPSLARYANRRISVMVRGYANEPKVWNAPKIRNVSASFVRTAFVATKRATERVKRVILQIARAYARSFRAIPIRKTIAKMARVMAREYALGMWVNRAPMGQTASVRIALRGCAVRRIAPWVHLAKRERVNVPGRIRSRATTFVKMDHAIAIIAMPVAARVISRKTSVARRANART